MNQRAADKEVSLQKILAAGAARLREEGMAGAAIAPVMQEAGLTHGAFYSHFADKNALVAAAFRYALLENRPCWMGRALKETWGQRLARLAKRYLTPAHRDDLANSCALAALASDAARAQPEFKQVYEDELRKSLHAICEISEDARIADQLKFEQAIAFMALCLGGIALSRAVEGKVLSERILEACRNAAGHIAFNEKREK
ncbi:MAG: TetR/AcrR family transcriptional regulator [Burkholderiales bacterium]|nr:TetR/AcrR family transcriptional regulator [Burkholderiales bacterium]